MVWCNVRVVGGLSKVGVVGEVEEDEEEAGDVDEEAHDDDGVAARTGRTAAHQAEQSAPNHFTETDENARDAHQLLGVVADLGREADAGAVDAAEERQLKSRVEECGAEERHLLGEAELHGALQGLQRAQGGLVLLLVAQVGDDGGPQEQHEDQPQRRDTEQHGEDELPRRLVDVRLAAEHEHDENVAEEHAALQHGPEHPRVPRDGLLGRVERQVVALPCPDYGRPEADDRRAHVQEPCRRVQERGDEEPVGDGAQADGGPRPDDGDDGGRGPVADGEHGVDDGQAGVAGAGERGVVVGDALQDRLLYVAHGLKRREDEHKSKSQEDHIQVGAVHGEAEWRPHRLGLRVKSNCD